MKINIKLIQNTKTKGRRSLEMNGVLTVHGDWTPDDVAAALLSLEVRANGVSADAELPSIRVHIEVTPS